MSDELRDELLTLARRTDRAALEAKFDEALAADPDNLELFLACGDVMANNNRASEAAALLSKLSDHYLEHGSPEQRVKLFQFLVLADTKERAHRKNFAQALLDANTDRPAYELFVDAADLVEGEPKAALALLDEMAAYDVGKFVFHASGWGVGRVDDVDTLAKELVVLFESGRRHSLPVRSALDILTSVPEDDWRVLRAFNQEEMQRICAEDPGELVARILKQVGRSLDSTSFKNLLLDKGIPKSQWSKWWTKARRSAMQRPDVAQEGRGNKLIFQDPEDIDVLAELEEALTTRQLLDAAEHHLRNLSAELQNDQEHLQAIITALVQGSNKHATKRDHSPLEMLLLALVLGEESELELETTPAEQALTMQLFQAEQYFQRLAAIKNLKHFKRGVAFVKKLKPESYANHLVELVPETGSLALEHVISECLDQGKDPELDALLQQAMKKPAELPELLCWARRRKSSPTYQTLLEGLDGNVLLQRCLALGETKGKAVDPELRRLARGVAQELIADNSKQLRAFLATISAEEARTLHRFIEGLRGFSENAHWSMLDTIRAVHSITKPEEEEQPISMEMDDNVIFCTEDGIIKRQKEYDQLVNVRLPQIFDAIGKAASFGDLSENAEYTAALEERAAMTRKAEEMKDELAKARKIDSSLLQDGVVTVGSRVTVFEANSGKEETYTLLGPWDADIDRGLLDYRAPLARALLGHELGTKVDAEIGGKTRNYELRKIEPAL